MLEIAAHAPEFAELFYLPSALSLQDTATIGAHLAEAVRNLTSSSRSRPRVRAFRAGVLDYRLSERLARSRLGPDSNVNEWLRAASGAEPGCVAINNLAAWSLPLSEWFAGLVRKITVDVGYEPLAGTDIYSFVAESEWTPFGIHCDDEPSMIFHLGPAEKTVWVWPEGALSADLFVHSPSFNGISFEIERHLESAESITLRPGDFISIPRGRYHLFRNEGPSAFVGLTIYPFSLTRSLAAALPAVIERLVPPAEEIRTAADFGSVVHGLGVKPAAQDRITDLVAAEFARNQAVARTQGYIAKPEQAALAGRSDVPAHVRGAFPGVAAADGPGAVLVRGRMLRVNTPVEFESFVELIDSGSAHSREEFIAALDIPSEAGRKVVEGVYGLGGLVAG
ncbi:hypothetical protein [Nocardia jinanensis]|uniref:Cupin domain-containing protein n=1 Tax=Nocardia jinanensis TaxID=382504 RepID=A0A917VW12_9NOCA|nr:hypothetical protein [Nocardia jinanensis]GGL28582.1 hypothetical protein GCM10011588_49320 [Nocardia jinanensis]